MCVVVWCVYCIFHRQSYNNVICQICLSYYKIVYNFPPITKLYTIFILLQNCIQFSSYYKIVYNFHPITKLYTIFLLLQNCIQFIVFNFTSSLNRPRTNVIETCSDGLTVVNQRHLSLKPFWHPSFQKLIEFLIQHNA